MTAIPVSTRRIAGLALPMAGEQFVIFGATLYDTALAGRLGAESLSAQAVVNQWVLFTSIIYQVMVVGGSILVAQRIGKRDAEGAGDVVAGTLALALVSGLVVAVVALLASSFLLQLMGVSPAVTALSEPYFRLMALTFPLNFVLLSAGGCLRGAGDGRTPLILMAVVNVVHVVTSTALVFGFGSLPGLGLPGIAVATLLNRLIGVALVLGVLRRGVAGLRLAAFRPRRSTMAQIWRVGSAVGGEQFVLRVGQLVNLRIVAGLSTAAIAAYAVAFNTLSLILMLGVGFMSASLALVGQQVGAGDMLAARRTGWRVLHIAWVIMGALALVFFLWPQPARLFSSDESVLDLAVSGLHIILIAVPFEIVNQVLTGGLRGMGDTAFPMWLTMVGHWLIRLPLMVVFIHGLNLGINGVWLATIIEMAIRSFLNAHRFRGAFRLPLPRTRIGEAQT